LIRFGQNQNLASPKTLDLLRLCERPYCFKYLIIYKFIFCKLFRLLTAHAKSKWKIFGVSGLPLAIVTCIPPPENSLSTEGTLDRSTLQFVKCNITLNDINATTVEDLNNLAVLTSQSDLLSANQVAKATDALKSFLKSSASEVMLFLLSYEVKVLHVRPTLYYKIENTILLVQLLVCSMCLHLDFLSMVYPFELGKHLPSTVIHY